MTALSCELLGFTPVWRESFDGVGGNLTRAKSVSGEDMASFGLSDWSFDSLHWRDSGELIVGWNKSTIGHLLSPAINVKVPSGSVLSVWARTRDVASGIMPVAIAINGVTNYLGDVQLTKTLSNYTFDIKEGIADEFSILLSSITNRASAATIIGDVAIWQSAEEVEMPPPLELEKLYVNTSFCRWHIDPPSLGSFSAGEFKLKGSGVSFLLDQEIGSALSIKDATKATAKGLFVYTNLLESSWFGFIPPAYENTSSIHSAEARFCISNAMERLQEISISFDIAQLDNANNADKVTRLEIEERTVTANAPENEWRKIGEYVSVYNLTNTVDDIKPDFAETMKTMEFHVEQSVRCGEMVEIRLITRKLSTGREAAIGFKNINISTFADYGQFRVIIR